MRKAEIGQFFTEKPWNAMGWTPLYTLPFGLGLGFSDAVRDVLFAVVLLPLLESGAYLGACPGTC